MSDFKAAGPLLIRVFLLLGSLYSAQQAWAAIPLYHGVRALDQGRFNEAAVNLRLSDERMSTFTETRLGLAEALFQKAIHEKDLGAAIESSEKFRLLTERFPYSGKIRMKYALAKSAAYRFEAALGNDKHTEILSLMEKAHRLQPESLWIGFFYALEILRKEDSSVSAASRKKAYALLLRAAEILPARYLPSALDYLWSRSQDLERLLSVTPSAHKAYKLLMDFLKSKEAWKEWHAVFPAYLELRQQSYERLCSQAEKALEEKKYSHAVKTFQEAVWLDASQERAQAGLLAAEYSASGLFRPSKESEETLLKIYEENTISEILHQHLRPLIDDTKNDYLRGLSLERSGDFQKALSYLKKGPDSKYAVLAQARVLEKLGKAPEAADLLWTSIGEDGGNLREIFFLYKNEQEKRPSILDIIKREATQRRPSKAWWNENAQKPLIKAGEKTGMKLTLLPGRSEIRISARIKEGKSGSALLIRLGEKAVGSLYVHRKEWQVLTAGVNTHGGEYWLSIEALSETASVELGGLLVRHELLGNDR